MQGDVLKKIPDENFRGSDLDLVPIDGVDLPPGSVGEVVNWPWFLHDLPFLINVSCMCLVYS